MPEWRKELGERVREVQERRAREALLETAEIGPLFSELDARTAPVLELLPQAEMPPMNPLVVAALQRIERARAQIGRGGGAATAIAYEQHPAEEINLPMAEPIDEFVPKPERVHTLAVVPNPESMSPETAERNGATGTEERRRGLLASKTIRLSITSTLFRGRCSLRGVRTLAPLSSAACWEHWLI